MKAILLARVSTEEQDTEAQLIKIQEYADQKGFIYGKDDVFDFHESAYKTNRENFDEVIKHVKKQKEKVALCCDKIDRLLRNFLHIRPIQELLEKDKIELHFSSENLVLNNESYATDKFKFNLGAMLAQYYSDSISDNVKRTINKRVKSGQILSKAPYGYRNVTLEDGTKTVEVEPFEAQVVLKLYEWYVSDSYSMSALRKKVKQLYKVEIAQSKLGAILENKFYIGIGTYKKQSLEYPHIYSRIVPEHIFYKVQEIKAGRTQWSGKGKYAGKSFYYRNLMKCRVCGYSVSPEEHRGKHYYRCTQHGGKHGAQYIEESILTHQFVEAFKPIKLTKEKAQKLVNDLKATNKTNLAIATDIITELTEKKLTYKKRCSQLYDDKADGSITSDFYEEKYKEYTDVIDTIDGQLVEVEKVDKQFYLTAGYVLGLAKHSAELFARSEEEERRILINTVLLNTNWDGKKLYYSYQNPFNLLVEMNNRPVWGRPFKIGHLKRDIPLDRTM